jgi:RNA polymerase sigma-70 factor (ECF subfamily)
VVTAGELFDAHRHGVFRYLCRMVGEADARDLTQQVFLQVARGPVPESPPHAQRAWVFRIAHNLALNHVRDDGRRPATVDRFDSSRLATQETAAAVHQALDTLGSLDREVFLLREVAGLSYEEIASACEMSDDAVRSRLHRARQQLRELLRPLPGTLTRDVRLYDKP